MNILQINASAHRRGSQSSQLADAISARLLARSPGAQLRRRELARDPHPEQDDAALEALALPAAQRSPAQAARVARDDALIAEIQEADVLVLAVPMYNFGIPAQLKNWIDAIARARVTFRYTDNGPEGLLKGKKVYVATTRGGLHRDLPSDLVEPYLRRVLAFLGMSDVEFFFAEGLALGAEALRKAMTEARAEIDAVIA